MRFLLSAFAALAMLSSDSSAATLTVTTGTVQNTPAQNLLGVRDDWFSMITPTLGFSALETFEGFEAGEHFATLDTAAGRFVAGGSGSTGAGTGGVEVSIHDKNTTPFSGRFNYTPEGRNWLDSNDITSMILNFAGLPPVNYLSFFLTDVNDVSGSLRLKLNNGEVIDYGFMLSNGRNKSGASYFVSYSGAALSSIEFVNNRRNDGYGIDDLFIGSTGQDDPGVPEPGTYVLLGAGLVGLAFWKRRS